MFFGSKRQEPPAMTLEGALGPNGRLDEAEGLRVEAPEALCVSNEGRLLYSSGSRIHALGKWGEAAEVWAEFDQPVSALCSSPGGLVAVGLAGGRVAVHDSAGQPLQGWPQPEGLASATDCMFLSEEELVVVDCGYRAGDSILSVAPWDETARGQVVAVKRFGNSRVLASGLHCPMGIDRDPAGAPIVSLLERASIVDMSGMARQSGYPAYLGRIRRTEAGYALACLARRDPLIEFLKTEPAFVAEMKTGMEPRYWISPRSSPEFSHDFPIELGATRLFGEVKPWAPSFSYGLVIELDESLTPVVSAHSRASGFRHAITDVASWNGELIAVSKASGEILNLGQGGAAR
jgi:hypothetical protein